MSGIATACRAPAPILTGLLVVLLTGCGGGDRLRLAVTTSLRDSGLTDVLVPAFEDESGLRVDVVTAGTGQVLALARAGDVDVVVVHSPPAEARFVAAGHARERHPVMDGAYLLVGPPDDPSGIRGLDPAGALRRIHGRGAPFVSRGDSSGTHDHEIRLAGTPPRRDGYVETGRGQGATLVTADQMRAYALTDLATWLRFRDRVDLAALVRDHPDLRNPYSVLVVDASVHPAVRTGAGERFAAFLRSPGGRALIDAFAIGGEHPFRAAP